MACLASTRTAKPIVAIAVSQKHGLIVSEAANCPINMAAVRRIGRGDNCSAARHSSPTVHQVRLHAVCSRQSVPARFNIAAPGPDVTRVCRRRRQWRGRGGSGAPSRRRRRAGQAAITAADVTSRAGPCAMSAGVGGHVQVRPAADRLIAYFWAPQSRHPCCGHCRTCHSL